MHHVGIAGEAYRFLMSGADGGRVLALHGIGWHGPQLRIDWGIDRYRFTTSLWYESVDWDDLTERFGVSAAETLAFHIAMFELDKGISFRPTELRIAAPWSDLVTDALLVLWRAVTRKVWAQWRYEHDLRDYDGPAYHGSSAPAPAITRPVVDGLSVGDEPTTLWFCGGGKDSLLASAVLDAVDARYDAFAYTHSVYGPAERQMGLVERLVAATGAGSTHRMFVFDDAIDLPLPRLPAVDAGKYVLAAETPASLFAALPIALVHGYSELVVAHERSANAPNLRWRDTGEDVNHQWGKSLEAEQLLGDYVRAHLFPGVRYYSVLAPVHDALIFGALRPIAERLPLTHSCNVAKPWCLRCAKCAYVWVCATAWLPRDAVHATFGPTNLLDLPENQLFFRQMLGLESHTPFECIGQIDEARLAFAMARARGITGRAMRHFEQVPGFDALSALDRYLSVDHTNHRLPQRNAVDVLAYFENAAVGARMFATEVLAEAAKIVP